MFVIGQQRRGIFYPESCSKGHQHQTASIHPSIILHYQSSNNPPSIHPSIVIPIIHSSSIVHQSSSIICHPSIHTSSTHHPFIILHRQSSNNPPSIHPSSIIIHHLSIIHLSIHPPSVIQPLFITHSSIRSSFIHPSIHPSNLLPFLPLFPYFSI